MSILFINGSPNKNGNTVGLAKELLAGKEDETLHLVDYKCWYYETAKDEGTLQLLAQRSDADFPQEYQEVRRWLRGSDSEHSS